MAPADLVAIFGIDAYRYYFMTDVPFGNDGSISMERMVQVYNADLANTWGNLCSRAFNMAVKYFDGVVPAIDADTYLYYYHTYAAYTRYYLNQPVTFCTIEQYNTLKGDPLISAAPLWPAQGSIFWQDGVLVIHLS